MNSHREEGSASRNRGNGENSASRNHGTKGTNGGTVGGIQTQFSQVGFPQFNGEDPTGWIYKEKKFFHYQRTENSEKITLASFHLLDDALQWY